MLIQKRKENLSPMSDEIIPKKKNTSKSALDETTITNTSVLSNETMETGTPKKNEKRYMVCHEILDTEENYLRLINVLMDVFKKPLEERIKHDEDLLSKTELNTLFKKLTKIIHSHTYIHQNLRKNLNEWKNTNLIGKIWADSAIELGEVYPPYINSYDNILKILDYNEINNPRFRDFIKKGEAMPQCQKNSIRDLFIRPVQRIPSVLLLMQELFKRTEKNNPDYPWIKGAIEKLKQVLEKTNESRRQNENYQQFLEICNDIEGLPNDVISASSRQFIQSIDFVVINAGGVLHKYKGKKLGLFLFNDFVEIAKARFCSSELNSTFGASGLNTSFNSGGSGTMNRQLSMGMLRRGASWKKERKRYKHIELHRFSDFRSVEMEREHEVFIVRIRDQKADELCFFKPINGYTMDMGVDFFENLIQRIITNSTRDISLEEVTLEQIREHGENRPEEVELIAKALDIAKELNKTGTISRKHSLRRSISSISLNPGWHPLVRLSSMKRPNLANIAES